MKSPTCVESRGIVSLKALFFAVVLGTVMGGLGSLLPSAHGQIFGSRCDWDLVCQREFEFDGGKCTQARCREKCQRLCDGTETLYVTFCHELPRGPNTVYCCICEMMYKKCYYEVEYRDERGNTVRDRVPCYYAKQAIHRTWEVGSYSGCQRRGPGQGQGFDCPGVQRPQ